jgi:hypothetical protein
MTRLQPSSISPAIRSADLRPATSRSTGMALSANAASVAFQRLSKK